MARKKGLGRGLDILIPKDNKNSDDLNGQEKKKNDREGNNNQNSPGQLSESGSQDLNQNGDGRIMIDINKIEPNRNQPRKQFDEEGIEELSDSIKQYGLIQPIVVQKKDDFYEIIAGERRWRACKQANLKEVPVIIKEYDEKDVLKISLIENLQRENLNPIEEAQAYQKLRDEYGLKQDEIALSVSKSRTSVTNTMRLLKLDERIQNLIYENQISSGHGRALLSIEDKELQYKTALKIRDDNLSVRESERLVKKILSESENEDTDENGSDVNKEEDRIFKGYEEQLKEIIGSKVVIKNRKNNKGKIEIDYYSKEEFERIIEYLQKE